MLSSHRSSIRLSVSRFRVYRRLSGGFGYLVDVDGRVGDEYDEADELREGVQPDDDNHGRLADLLKMTYSQRVSQLVQVLSQKVERDSPSTAQTSLS